MKVVDSDKERSPNLAPGDLVEWTYKTDGDPVRHDEILWSTIDQRWCYIGGQSIHICVGIFEDTIVWLNDRGLFHARVDESTSAAFPVHALRVVPRLRMKDGFDDQARLDPSSQSL